MYNSIVYICKNVFEMLKWHDSLGVLKLINTESPLVKIKSVWKLDSLFHQSRLCAPCLFQSVWPSLFLWYESPHVRPGQEPRLWREGLLSRVWGRCVSFYWTGQLLTWDWAKSQLQNLWTSSVFMTQGEIKETKQTERHVNGRLETDGDMGDVREEGRTKRNTED